MLRNEYSFETPVSREELENFTPSNEFFIGIDSDGCVFDSMTIKHRTCFAPAFIEAFGLEPVANEAREVWEYVNLFSRTRGTNRFQALNMSIEYMRKRTGIALPNMDDLKDWLKRETRLGNPALEEELKRNDSLELRKAYEWSLLVNLNVETNIDIIPPFPNVAATLEKIKSFSDIMIVSQTPLEAIVREWNENKIIQYADFIAGQEIGTKSEHLAFGARGKYTEDKILLLGDAPGDLKAARENGILFFPIIPGREIESWEIFESEAVNRFKNGTYRGDFENKRISEFEDSLPDSPPWEHV